MRASIKVFGETQFDREIRATGSRARRGRPFYNALGEKLQLIQREQFRTAGARSGHPWAPLAPSTVRRKGHATILVDSGALRDSFNYGDPNNIFEATDDYLHWGSEVDYGGYHQPDPQERRVFALSDADRIDIVKDMQAWVISGSLP